MNLVLPASLVTIICTAAPRYTVDQSSFRGRSVIVDEHGREVVFRGVNVGVEIWKNDHRPWEPSDFAAGKCPSANTSVNQPPVCEMDAGKGKWNQSTSYDSKNDLAQMRSLGFNLIRLAMSWSLLEPEPLQYCQKYLDRIAQVVEWAREQNIEVILDMHQDEYSPSIGGSDGAPYWACLNVTLPAWVEAIWRKISGVIPYSKEVLSAFDTLYMNHKVESTGKGLQEHFLLAWAEVVKRFDSVPNVIGYEIINEPPPGIMTILDSVEEVPVLGFSTRYLYPLYRRFIQAVTGVRDGMPDCPSEQPINAWGMDCAFPNLGINSHKLVLFEPMALRNQLDFSLQISKPFTEYGNIVFAPHAYTHFFTFDNWPPTYRLSLDSAWFEANLMGASVLVTEFGGSASSADKVSNITVQFDIHRGTSNTLWTWKEHGDWGMFDGSNDPSEPNGPVKDIRVQINSRIYARAVVGKILEHAFDHLTGAFRLRAAAGPRWKHATEIYVPQHLVQAKPVVHGMAHLTAVQTQPDGSQVVEVMPWITGGLYEVRIGETAVLGEMAERQYCGLSQEILEKLARAVWPLDSANEPHNSTQATAEVLHEVAQELYGGMDMFEQMLLV